MQSNANETLHDNTRFLLEDVLGSSQTYIKYVMEKKGPVFGIYAVDGTQLATFKTYDEAFSATKLFDLDVVTLQ